MYFACKIGLFNSFVYLVAFGQNNIKLGKGTIDNHPGYCPFSPLIRYPISIISETCNNTKTI